MNLNNKIIPVEDKKQNSVDIIRLLLDEASIKLNALSIGNINVVPFSTNYTPVTREELGEIYRMSMMLLTGEYFEIDQSITEIKSKIEELLIDEKSNSRFVQAFVRLMLGFIKEITNAVRSDAIVEVKHICKNEESLKALEEEMRVLKGKEENQRKTILLFETLANNYIHMDSEVPMKKQQITWIRDLQISGRTLMTLYSQGKNSTPVYQELYSHAQEILTDIVNYDPGTEELMFEDQMLKYQSEILIRIGVCRQRIEVVQQLNPLLRNQDSNETYHKLLEEIETYFTQLMEICKSDKSLFDDPLTRPVKKQIESALEKYEEICAISKLKNVNINLNNTYEEVNNELEALHKNRQIIYHSPEKIYKCFNKINLGIPPDQLKEMQEKISMIDLKLTRERSALLKEKTEDNNPPILMVFPPLISSNVEYYSWSINDLTKNLGLWTLVQNRIPHFKNQQLESYYANLPHDLIDEKFNDKAKMWTSSMVAGTRNINYKDQINWIRFQLGKDQQGTEMPIYYYETGVDTWLAYIMHFFITGQRISSTDRMRLHILGLDGRPITISNKDNYTYKLYTGFDEKSENAGMGASSECS